MTQQLPQGFTVSATTWDDLAAVTNLTRINEIALYGKPETTEDDIRTHWQGPTFNLATDAWVVKSPQAKIIGAAAVGNWQYIKLWFDIEVHPDYRERGFETYLMGLAEKRAQALVSKAPTEA